MSDEEKEFNNMLDSLDEAINSIGEKLENKEFLELIDKLNQKHPLMYLPDLLDDFVRGESLVEILYKHHLVENSKVVNLFQYFLKIKIKNRTRKSLAKSQRNQDSTEIKEKNLSDPDIGPRYNELTALCKHNIEIINSNLIYNLIRAYTILLFFIKSQTIKHDEIPTNLLDIIKKYSHLVRSKPEFNPDLKNYINDKTINRIIHELIINEHIFPDEDDPKLYILSPKYLKIPSLIRNIITKNENGISYPRLFREIHKKRTLFDLIPNTGIIVNAIQELVDGNEILRKRGLNGFYDQFFIPSDYEKQSLQLEKSINQQGKKKFFGRRVTPDDFISELYQLGRGDFEPEDDQVTRIAGMVLSNAAILRTRSQSPPLFDFSIDMNNYKFTSEQLQVLQETKIQLSSNIVHISVMINDKLDFDLIKDMIREIPENEQGLIICFDKIFAENIFQNPNNTLNKFLEENKIIQVVTESNFRKWCQITPVIPCRLGAIARIRYGDHAGQLAQINSINYESGLAEITTFPSMIDTTQYIGSMQEISFSSVNEFREISSNYLYFLQLLFDSSYGDEFKKIILDTQDHSHVKTEHELQSISCTFPGKRIAQIDAGDPLTESCNCSIWKEFSESDGLCSHLIFAYNAWFMQLVNNNERKITSKILHRLFLLKGHLKSPMLNDEKVCPNCGVIAKTIAEQDDLFGNRIANGKVIPQSWCRKCRK